MSREDILEGMKNVLSPYTVDKEALHSITEDTDLIKDLKINSANLVDIIIDAEEKYNIEIDVDTAERIRTTGDCITIILDKMNEKQIN